MARFRHAFPPYEDQVVLIMTSRFLPYGRQTIDDDDIDAVVAALRSDFLTTGPLVEDLEKAFAAATGAPYAVVVNSGTAALHLASTALGLGPGDVAIVPTMTFVGTANAVRMTGADVMLADVGHDDGLMNSDTFLAAIDRAAGKRLRAALPVHLNGRLCDIGGLRVIADRHGISLIEDACHSLGVPGAGKAAASRAACFSTHPVKAITTGEGGVVVTREESLAEHVRRLRSHGITRNAGEFLERDMAFDASTANPWYYEMQELGWNYRLPDVLCALGLSQLKKLDRFWRRRCEIAALYDEILTPLAPMLRPAPRGEAPHGLHLYVVLVEFDGLRTTRARFMKELRDQGIATQVHYIPVHRHPYYRSLYGEQQFEGADAYYARCLSIPIFPTMTDSEVERVGGELARLVGGRTFT